MPLVRSYLNGQSDAQLLETLEAVCEELIPATYSTPRHPVTPGSIIWTPPVLGATLKVDVFIEAEGFRFPDREEIIQDRADELKEALSEIYPHTAFAVWPKLVIAGWAADYADPDFEGRLTMDAAVGRLKSLGFGR